MRHVFINYLFLLFTHSLTLSISAKILPSLKEKGWSSYYAGYRGSGIEMAINTRGKIQLFFTPKRNERLNRVWPIEAEVRLERREKGHEKWVQRKTIINGFIPEDKVELGQPSISFKATSTGDVKFKVTVKFDKNGLEIQSEMANAPADVAEAEYRLTIETDMPSMLQGSSKYNEKELKSKTRGDQVLIAFKKEKEQKIPLYKIIDTDNITEFHPTSITLKADKIGRKKLTWSLLDRKDHSAIEISCKSTSKRFLDGFNMRLILVDENSDPLSKGLRIEYK